MFNLIYATLFMTMNFSPGEMMPNIKDCPDKPNCVFSKSQKEYAIIEPLPLLGDKETSLKKIKEVMAKLPRTKLIKEGPNYLHFTSTTKIMRFTDDVEFEIDEKNNVVHIKSASRVGYKDFGTNRERVEEIRSLYQ